MLTLYLDYELDEDERIDVQLAVGEEIELRRIPWLFPLPRPGEEAQPMDPQRVIPHLRRVGIGEFDGERILLVAPQAIHWYASLAEAIFEATGQYPLLVQPAERRSELGCAGPLRIIDMEAYLRDEDAAGLPPWLVNDEDDPLDLR